MDPVIPGYKIIRILGKGGMATVYLAVQEIFERQVALKVMDARLAEDPTFGQRFLREAKIVSQLMHPNIVTVFDVGVHENYYYFSMEYIAGLDLKTGYHLLRLSEKIQIIQDVALALSFAASKGYVHRDIKVENILLREQNRQAVLMDFGIARAATADMSVTQTGAALGTPHYMSPEQASGGAIDHRSDLYSLGIVFYYLLMGFVPYRGDSAVTVGIKHLTAPIPQLPEALADLQPILDALLAKSPEQRFQSADELIEYLAGVDLDALEEIGYLFSKPFDKNNANGEPTEKCTSDLDATLVELESVTLNQESQYSVEAEQGAASVPNRNYKKTAIWVMCISVLIGSGIFTQKHWPFSAEKENLPTEQQSLAQFDWPDLTQVDKSVQGGLPNNRILKKINSSIRGLANKFQHGDSTIEYQVIELQREIAEVGDSPERQARLDELAKLAFTEVFAVLNAGDFEQGNNLLSSYRDKLADAWQSDPPLRRAIEQLLGNAQELENYQARALLSVKEKRYIAPEGDNALLYYQKMLQLQPQFGGAISGLQGLLLALQKDAEESYQSGSWGRAYSFAKTILILNPSDKRAMSMALEIERYQQQENDIADWLRRAELMLAEENFYHPEGQNAYQLYQQVLQLRPNHFQAKAGMGELKKRFSEKIQLKLNAGEKEGALTDLNMALSVANDDHDLIELRQRLLGVAEGVSPGTPHINRLLVSDSEIASLKASQKRTLHARKTLYGAIAYSGFVKKNQVLVAQLEDAQGSILEQLTLVIATDRGEQRFRIDHAIENFRAGRYRLLFLLNGQPLIETGFKVSH